jgi:hypothetical protein
MVQLGFLCSSLNHQLKKIKNLSMKKILLLRVRISICLVASLVVLFVACDKSVPDGGVNTPPYYNLDVVLSPITAKSGLGDQPGGFLKFRQDPDTARIITLDTWVFHLQPNHAYALQRAVDPISSPDCVSTAWLTLGKGLVPQAINTDAKGDGEADLFRDVTSVARGTQFRIHFQIIDLATGATVLTSDCTQYTVR